MSIALASESNKTKQACLHTLLGLCALWLWPEAAGAGTQLPIPCAPGACGKTGASQFVTVGSATAVATRNALTINQTSSSAILNWSSFNIGQGDSVTFKQPTSTAIALNRINQAASPVQIFGQLSANGQIYLINLNGFLFGPKSMVNVGSLLVSSLPLALSDADFAKGILAPLQDAHPVLAARIGATEFDPLALNGRTDVLDANGDPVLDSNGNPIPVQVVVQPGAQMTAGTQGRLLLAGQQVTNGGTLTAPDGQVILAAGRQVYLQADSDPSVRGLVVEVDQGGTAWNQLSGLLSAPTGNITMVGLAVNQDGRISATTSVAANGSIRLEAADTHQFGSTTQITVSSSHGGTLTIGPESEMQILPGLSSDATAVPAQTQYPSSITLLGEQVIIQGGSISAPNGNLTAIAAANPSVAAADPATGVSGSDPNARLRIDSGASIDLSGSHATLPVSANIVSAQLRANEFADDPTQRDGPLHGQTVYFDIRNPPPENFANLSGEIAAVAQNIAQRTATGGNAIFQSEGDIVFAQGASLNVSGGSTTYTGGVIQTSYLVGANGQLYPIATANPLLNYVGVFNPTVTQTYNTWGVQEQLPTPALSHYQMGYAQGMPAGTVQFAAATMVLQGTLLGSAVNGLYQRTPSTEVPGGTLTLGLPLGVGGTEARPPLDYLSPAIRLTSQPTPVIVADDASLPGPLTLELPTAYLTSSGFTNAQIYSNYDVTLPPSMPLTLPPGSTLAVNAARIDLGSTITDSAGTLNFQSVFNVGSASATSTRPGVYVGDNVTLDVRGLWTNDLLNPNAVALSQTWQNAGQINLGVAAVPGALLSLGNNVDLRASGGAWLSNTGALTAGKGGSITLNAGAISAGLDTGVNLSVDGFGVNGAAGGSFSLTAPRIEVSGDNGAWSQAQQVDDAIKQGGVFQVPSDLFSGYGFQSVNLVASGLVAPEAPTTNVLIVDAGTAINATVSSLLVSSSAYVRPSAETLDGIATVRTLPTSQRPAARVSLSVSPPAGGSNPPTDELGMTSVGDILIGTGSSISTDPGGSIGLSSIGSIVVDGALQAAGGSVTLNITGPGNYDSGFLANQRIELGATGTIDVSGTFVPQPSSFGLILGNVLSGGSVGLLAARGAVVTDNGSMISASGTSAQSDVLQATGSYSREVSSTAGGSITVQSGEAISLLGDINAGAGPPGTLGPAAAGSLSVALSRSESWWAPSTSLAISATFNPGPLQVQLVPSGDGLPVSPPYSNLAVLGATQLTASGIDGLTLEAGDLVEFSGLVSLNLGRQFLINSPAIGTYFGAQARVTAPYVELGYSTAVPPHTPAASGGTGSIGFSGAEVDIAGTIVFQGTSNVQLKSSGDLLLRGANGVTPNTLTGGVSVDGNLTLNAARIYPVADTQFQIDVPGNPLLEIPGSVSIGQTGSNPGTPLTAGATLTITTDTFASSGTLYAPFGSININASKSLTLGEQSVTSVSGNGLTIPFGETQLGGGEWDYTLIAETPQIVTGVPTRLVNASAPVVAISKGATVDLTGGGDLFAYEWVPGPGGTTDALAPGTIPALYAVLASTRGQGAPRDPFYSAASDILPGQSVQLSTGSGLAAGTYPLLPARYALVPGAYLIMAEPKLNSFTPGMVEQLADGTPVVAGFYSYGTTGLHQSPGYIGFAVRPGSYGSQLAQYDLSTASTYFSAAASAAGLPRPTLPADAGSLGLNAAISLNLAGQVLTAAASGGLAAPIDISANDLVVGNASGPVPADAVRISGSVLASWEPGSLLLGGDLATDASTVNVLANTVTIGAGTPLTADQIVLVANHSIDVQRGATLQSTSAKTGTAPAVLPVRQSITLSDSSGGTPALLAVSDLNWLIPSRTGGAAAGAATVAVDAGATLASHGSLTLDGIGGVTLSGMELGQGAEWSFGSASIAFVPAGVHADALSIDAGLIAQLNRAGAVRLAALGSIDLLTPAVLGVNAGGSPALQSLTLVASSLNNLTSSGGGPGATTSQFGAQTLSLQGSGAGAPGVSGGPSGSTLSLNAGTLNIGPSTLAVNGFAATNIVAFGAVIGQGSGGLSVGGDLSIAAAAVTAGATSATAADPVAASTPSATIISALGTVKVTAAGGSVTLPPQLGGELTVSGASLDISGTVAAPAGILSLTSIGNLSVNNGASVSAAGSVAGIGNQSAGTPGGSISMAAGGDLVLSPGARVEVSGAGTSAAGTLTLAADGSASVGSTLRGTGGSGAAGGSFSLDAGSLANPLGPLSSTLASGGFNNAINVRVHTGDLTLAPGSTLAANSITLAADTGRVDIQGVVSAESGALRGALSIFGGTGVELSAGAALHANGAGSSGRGGTIEIGTGELVADQTGSFNAFGGGNILLDAGSTISAAGAAGNGTLLLRAPALPASNEYVAISLASNTSAVGQIIIEPVLPFNTATFSSATAPSAADFQQVQQAVGNYMALAGPAISARLGANAGAPLVVEPGVEIIASGPLTLPTLDLAPTATGSNWRFNGAPVDLTIRATGDITVASTISDGFDQVTVNGVQQPSLLAGASSSIRLVAGADFSGASPLDVITGGPGSLTIDPGAVVRTGTGDLDLVAAQDIVLGAGAQAYTAGTIAIAPGGSEQTPYVNVPPANGVALPYGIQVPNTSLLFSYPTDGGNLAVRAGEDITGTTPAAPGVQGWQLREGGGLDNNNNPILPEWGVNLVAYDWSFGTLGGGDLSIAAGRDALTVTAAAADSLLPPYGGGKQYVLSGGLSFSAGRDIGSAQVFLGDGTGTVAARGALTALIPTGIAGQNVGSAFYLQASSIEVTARLGIAVDGVFNPTALRQGSDVPKTIENSFLTYADNSSLALQSVAGDILVGTATEARTVLLGQSLAEAVGGVGDYVLPPNLTIQALGGNIEFGTGLATGASVLYPSANGQLDLLAAQNISNAYLTMSDAPAGTYSTVDTPTAQTPVGNLPFFGAIHIADPNPALVTAGGSLEQLILSLPKPAILYAGKDIMDLTYAGQNFTAADQTVLEAGRDIVDSISAVGEGLNVGGPGQFDILAARNVTLGFSNGITTSGNLLNSNLASSQGANISLLTGLGTQPDISGFVTQIIAPSSTYQAQLVSYVETLQGSPGLSFAQAETAFNALPLSEQLPMVEPVFFNELLLSGRAANTIPSPGFTEGYAAIDALYPGSRTGTAGAVSGAYAGDLSLSFSQIYTLSGGNISLLIPGGSIDVGLANPPPTLGTKPPSQLGIVTEGSGNVDIYSQGDVNVNSSRIFTLDGGNILIWSDEGSIDAGRGAKSSVSAPPPTILINANGTVSLNFAGSAAGSGIRTIEVEPSVPPGNVDLIAPAGTVNAGDAGIGSSGNINIAAASVIGVSNINFGGTATGVPAQVSSVGASLSGASAAASSASNTSTAAVASSAAENAGAAPLSEAALSWLDVFVTGLGEENCKPDDIECLKRQKTATQGTAPH